MLSILDSLSLLGLNSLEIVILIKTYNSKTNTIDKLVKELEIDNIVLLSIINNLSQKGFLTIKGKRLIPINKENLNKLVLKKSKELKKLKKEFPRFELLLKETTKHYDNSGKLNSRLNTIRDHISGRGGRIKDCDILIGNNTKNFFENSYNKIICTPKAFEKWITKVPTSEIITFGGVCVLRTFENKTLSSKSMLVDVKTGKLIKPNSIKILIKWLENNISLDQIVCSVLENKSNNYIIYTEEFLWSKKIIDYYEKINKTELDRGEKEKIFKACEKTELKKFQLIGKYLKYISNTKIKLTHIKDTDIQNILVKSRDTVYKKTDINTEKIVEVIKSYIKDNKSFNEKEALNYINNYSLVWTLFTGVFWDLMYKNKVINKEKIIITVPWDMTYPSDNDGKSYFNDDVFSNENKYLETGINKNVSCIAIAQPSSFNHKIDIANKPISQVPNVLNWENWIKELKKEEIKLNLEENLVYMAGANYLPHRVNRGGYDLLKGMQNIEQRYMKERKNIKNGQNRKTKINNLKKKLLKEAKPIQKEIIKEIEELCKNVFGV